MLERVRFQTNLTMKLHNIQLHNRGRSNSCSRAENKACRERQRREKLNDRFFLYESYHLEIIKFFIFVVWLNIIIYLFRFLELSSTLEPGRPVTNDKLAILGDAIRVLNQLKSESQECKEMNEKLLEEIKTLKVSSFFFNKFLWKISKCCFCHDILKPNRQKRMNFVKRSLF